MKILQGIIVLILLAFLAGSVVAAAAAVPGSMAPMVKPTLKATPTPIRSRYVPENASRSAIPAPFITKPSTYPYNYPPRNIPVRGSTQLRFLQVRNVPMNALKATTPAQNYGIYGLGGYVPNRKVTPTPKPIPRTSTIGMSGLVPLNSYQRYAARGPGLINGVVFPTPSAARRVSATPRPRVVIFINPNASPTPVPGGYTPRFPGEPGYKSSPTPTVRPTVTLKPTVRR